MVKHGMNILHGPPLLGPALMIISAQGGGGDGIRQTRWPHTLVYGRPDNRFQFGRRMRADFERHGMLSVLLECTVATNIAFPQHVGTFDQWRKQPGSDVWLKKSKAWVTQLIKLMPPAAILTYGRHAFHELTGARKRQHEVSEGSYAGKVVVGCGHLMQDATKNERDEAMRRVRMLTG